MERATPTLIGLVLPLNTITGFSVPDASSTRRLPFLTSSRYRPIAPVSGSPYQEIKDIVPVHHQLVPDARQLAEPDVFRQAPPGHLMDEPAALGNERVGTPHYLSRIEGEKRQAQAVFHVNDADAVGTHAGHILFARHPSDLIFHALSLRPEFGKAARLYHHAAYADPPTRAEEADNVPAGTRITASSGISGISFRSA